MTLPALLLATTTSIAFPAASTNSFDSEVIRTVPLNIDLSRLESLSFTLNLTPTPNANLEIGIGCDANDNGKLELLEADLTFGYDCGEWFLANTETGTVEPYGSNTWVIAKRDFKPSWNALRLVRRGTGELSETLISDEKHLRFVISIR